MSATEVTMQGLRVGISAFENVPEYVQPAVQGTERQLVSRLTGIPDTALTYVVRKCSPSCSATKPSAARAEVNWLAQGNEILELQRAGVA